MLKCAVQESKEGVRELGFVQRERWERATIFWKNASVRPCRVVSGSMRMTENELSTVFCCYNDKYKKTQTYKLKTWVLFTSKTQETKQQAYHSFKSSLSIKKVYKSKGNVTNSRNNNGFFFLQY